MATNRSQHDLLMRMQMCVQQGKSDKHTDIPPGSRGQSGVVELVSQSLDSGLDAQTILNEGLIPGLREVGRRFAVGEAFIPELLIGARAMKAGVRVLEPALRAANAPTRGDVLLGTVRGDLHDIGKNLVAIMLESAGWQVEDLGVDCTPECFVEALERKPGAVVGMSALLTTTMLNMRETIAAVRERRSDTIVLIGGAPVTQQFADEIGADGYAENPSDAIELLDRLAPGGHR